MEPEFSRIINADRVQVDSPRAENITANEKERAALAERFEILAIDKLVAAVTLTRLPDDPAVIMVAGHVSADVQQACVVTAEPVPEVIDEEFETLVASPAYVEKWLAEHGEDDLDAPEAVEHGRIDIGEIAAQYLALALNPYPRKDGLAYAEEPPPIEPPPSPFAVLAALKDKVKDKS
jgi:uncharacterized metal-binding protein YceD (DUF177 family)